MAKQTTKQIAKKPGATSTSKNAVKSSSKSSPKSSGKNTPKKPFFLISWAKNTVNYLVASYGELKKVTWPTRKELMKSTGVVILLIAIFTVVIFSFDTIFSYLTQLIYALKITV